MHDDTHTACFTPRCAANAASNASTRGPAVSQPERSDSATAAVSLSRSRRSNSGTAGPARVPVMGACPFRSYA